MPSVLADRYELRARIGSGGMATVWRGFDRRLGREVAVKVLSEALTADETFRRRFEREARHIASLAHPNIVAVHDFGVDGNQPFIVMELVKGKNLRQLLTESSPLAPQVVTVLAADILAGLGHAHDSGILHRDIKPGNILVTATGMSKLADFGIAKATEETVDLTDSGAIFGTVSYASPEQLSGHPLGPPSDLYSLGCVLYECLAGRPPFVADNIAALVSQQQFAAPEPLRDISSEAVSELDDTIMQALEKDPTQRFGSAGEMKVALGAVVSATLGRQPSRSTKKTRSGAQTATVTVLFCDVVGSTALQVAIGDDAADEIRRNLFGLLRSVVERNKGDTVKTLGDGLMAVFPESAVDALHCAIEIIRSAPNVADGLAMRVGVSHGEVTSEGGDWFGTPVVEAARLESAAKPGTVLAAQVVRIIVGSRGGFVFDGLPPIALKGLPGPVQAVRVRDANLASPPADASGLINRIRTARRPRRLLSRQRIVAGAVLALVVLAGSLIIVTAGGNSRARLSSAQLTQTDVGYRPRLASVTCPPDAGGGPGVTCDTLIVPQDRTHPKGRQVRLLVTRFRAETSRPAPDPVLDVGDPANNSVGGTFSTARLYSDYIELSMRGSQGSSPELACPEEEVAAEAALALPPFSSEAMTNEIRAFSACRRRLVASGIDPNDYGADAMAADVRDLLRALHVGRVNLVAANAGSTVAFDIVRQYPERVRTVAVQDPIPPNFDVDYSTVADLNASLQRYAALCAADQQCRVAFPDILGQGQRDFVQWQNHPVTVNVSFQPGRAAIPVLVDGQSGDEALASALAGPGMTVVASELYAPNPALVAETAASYSLGNGEFPWGVYASFLCKDELPGTPFNRQQEEAADALAYPQLAGVDAAAQLDPRLCQAWSVQPDDPSDFMPVVSDIPTFLFGGAINPYEASAGITQIAQGLPHAVTVIFPTLTASSWQTGTAPTCLTQLRLKFLRHPTSHLEVSKCTVQSPPIAFAGA